MYLLTVIRVITTINTINVTIAVTIVTIMTTTTITIIITIAVITTILATRWPRSMRMLSLCVWLLSNAAIAISYTWRYVVLARTVTGCQG